MEQWNYAGRGKEVKEKMQNPERPEPHINFMRNMTVVLLVVQIFSSYWEDKVHQELYETLVEVQKNLNQAIENQNLHLQNILDLVDLLQERYRY